MFLKEETLVKPTADCFILYGFLWCSFRFASFLATYIYIYVCVCVFCEIWEGQQIVQNMLAK